MKTLYKVLYNDQYVHITKSNVNIEGMKIYGYFFDYNQAEESANRLRSSVKIGRWS